MYVCLDCRVGSKGIYPLCLRDSHNTLYFGKKVTVPKKNNKRAWKRIAAKEYLWDRRHIRKVRRDFRDADEVSIYTREPYECGDTGITRYRVVEERTTTNFQQRPHVDLGG